MHYAGREITGTDGGFIDPGMPMPDDARRIHGITDALLASAGAVTLETAVPALRDMLVHGSQAGIPLVGMNLRYDLAVIDANARRIDGVGLIEAGWRGPVCDVLVIDRALDRYRTGKRTLALLAATYGVALAQAHEASADVRAAVDVLFALADRYPAEVSERSLDELYALQRTWHGDWARSFSDWLIRQDRAPLPATEADWPLGGGDVLPVAVPQS